MIKILHINSSISTNSGVMSVIMNYYRHIDTKKVQFDFMYYIENENNYKSEIKKIGGNYYFIDNPKKLFQFQKKLDVFLKKHHGEYKIIHLHDIFLARFIYKIAKNNGIEHFIVHCHSAKWSSHFFSGVRNKILCQHINCYADEFFACSNAAGTFVYNNKVHYSVINNAINVEKFKFVKELREQLREDMGLTNKIVIGHVGRFSKEKNHQFLIQIFKQILDKNKEAILLLIGEGELKNEIEMMTKALRIENNVVFLGNRKDVHMLYQIMDVFVLPSLYEGLPLVGVEAQINGLRCVMSENVTQEVQITDVSFLSLSENKEIWSETIIKKAYEERIIDSIDIVREKGFSIADEAQKLQERYENMLS